MQAHGFGLGGVVLEEEFAPVESVREVAPAGIVELGYGGGFAGVVPGAGSGIAPGEAVELGSQGVAFDVAHGGEVVGVVECA